MEIKQEWFHNKSSYEAFLYAVELVEKIKRVQENGGIVFESGEQITGEWEVRLNPDDPCIGVKEGICFLGYVGSCWDAKTGKTYCTKKEVKESFGNISWVYPQDFHKLF